MRNAASGDVFLRAPLGKWCVVGNTVMWCHSATLYGTASWGAPDAAEAREVVRLWRGMEHLARRFDVLFDVSMVERVDPMALSVLLDWGRAHLDELSQRVRTCVGIVPAGVDGVTMSGISAAVGGAWPVKILRDPREGFRQLHEDGDALCDEVAAIVADRRGVPPVVARLRHLLDGQRQALDLADAARRLNVSVRALQRQLHAAGTSFREEQSSARFRAAEELLATDEKLGAVAARLGMTEAGLTLLVRAHTGLTPGEWRRRRVRGPVTPD